MGILMSLMGKGMPSVSMVTDTLYKQFLDKEIKEFDDFHMAILDIFSTFNAALPGKHYDVPPREDVERYFDEWNRAVEEERKTKFVEFVTSHTTKSKLDEATLVIGLITPPAAMALKRAGENVPQLNLIKHIPDVIFVPSATLVTLVSMKLTRRISSKEQAIEASKANGDKQ